MVHTPTLLDRLTVYIDKSKDLLLMAMVGRSLLCSHTINEEPFQPNWSPLIVG